MVFLFCCGIPMLLCLVASQQEKEESRLFEQQVPPRFRPQQRTLHRMQSRTQDAANRVEAAIVTASLSLSGVSLPKGWIVVPSKSRPGCDSFLHVKSGARSTKEPTRENEQSIIDAWKGRQLTDCITSQDSVSEEEQLRERLAMLFRLFAESTSAQEAKARILDLSAFIRDNPPELVNKLVKDNDITIGSLNEAAGPLRANIKALRAWARWCRSDFLDLAVIVQKAHTGDRQKGPVEKAGHEKENNEEAEAMDWTAIENLGHEKENDEGEGEAEASCIIT